MENVDLFYLACERMYSTLATEIAWVMDTRRMTGVGAAQRQRVVEHMQRVDHVAARYVVGVAGVVESPVMRGAYTAITWFFKPAYPIQLFADRQTAEQWCMQQLAGHRK